MNGQEFLIKINELLDLNKVACAEFARATEATVRAARPMMLAVDEENLDDEKYPMDLALLRAAPVVAVPVHSEFFPLQENGHRLLLATDGIYLEVRRPWLHFTHRLAAVSGVRVPYGPIKAGFELAFGSLGKTMEQLQDFALHASAAAPLEAAASVIWNHSTSAWRIEYPETIGEASATHIQFKQVEIGDDESVVVDLHSHGNLEAFFSSTDDQDDAGSVKIAGVYGSLDKDKPTVEFRLCVLGLTIPIKVPADRIFA
ncbi:PRTRC system protein A [Rugamonas sp. DEMB1]|uniref:PRTRC system protein A n=1 Tax=Rugamonas sp. DEMB1 TaxID=3039386 RepID=UPI00244B8B12|nr:PRTRC system protein A [Rugamonas sp. DEMB1]WGG51794.1 PRTRC system protein A [Rugamonas sp. DEMB1]